MMRYPFEPPDFEPGDIVHLVPPSPEAPAPGPCGHTPLQMWEEGGAGSGADGIVIRTEGVYPVSCVICDAWFFMAGVMVQVPNADPAVLSPWQLELIRNSEVLGAGK